MSVASKHASWSLGILLWGVMLVSALHAAQPYQPSIVNPLMEPWRWKYFPELEGKGVRHIAQAEDDKVWISSNQGVLEYDGYHWKLHDADNGLAASSAEQVLVARDGSIYVTAPNGIFRYQNDAWHHFFVAPDKRSFIFHQLKELSDGSIVACSDWGVIRFRNTDNLQFFTTLSKITQLRAGLPDVQWVKLPAAALSQTEDFVYFSDILETQSKEIWLSLTTEQEIGSLLRFRWQDATDGSLDEAQVYNQARGFKLGEAQTLLEAQDGQVWVGNSTTDKGLYIFHGEEWKTISLHEMLGGDEFVSDITQSEDGTIWLSGLAKLLSYKNGRWQRYRAPDFPVPANRIILQNGRNDQLWVAGYKSKVMLLDFSVEQWLTYENLSYQCTTADGTQWFLERNNRLVSHRQQQWTAFGPDDGLMDSPIRIITTSQGQVWAAGSHQGKAATAVLRPDGWELHLHPNLSWGIDYRAILEDEAGGLWFGAAVDADLQDGFRSGVLHLAHPTASSLRWTHHVAGENGLNQTSIYGIGQSADGRIWIGGSRLRYYADGIWQYLPDERLQQYVNVVRSQNGLLLVGSRYYGLFLYDGEEWKNYTTQDGLSGNTIISIDLLADSSILVATENSISRFDGQSWTNDIFPEQLNLEHESGSLFHSDQYIWINHTPRAWKRRAYQGISEAADELVFFTSRYRPSTHPPETEIDFFMEEISPDGNAVFSWSGRDYFGVSATGRVVYAYRLDGGEWSPFSADQQHTFTSLPSGPHTLEVRARDLDHNIDPTPAIISFCVKPVFWKRGWFIALILTFLTIYGVYEYRVVTKKRKLEILNASLQEANRKLQERGHQIEMKNQEILGQQQQILQQSQKLEDNNLNLERRNRMIRQQKEELEVMVEQVERLSKAKLGFFTNISHELRTPLSLILGPISQLLKKEDETPPKERQQHYLTIKRNASRLLKLIDQLLEMRRIEQSTLELKFGKVDLAHYTQSLVELFQGLAKRRKIALNFVDHSQAAIASIDADKVDKIVANLLSNAFKHTPKQGAIHVQLSVVEPKSYALNEFYPAYFELLFKDSGCGISPDQLDHIFDKYYTTESKRGFSASSGIGLSYVKDLVYLLQGEIRVESEVDQGTTFRVYLPCFQEEGRKATQAQVERPPMKVAQQEASLLLSTMTEEEKEAVGRSASDQATQAPHLLVVEDNPDMRQFLERLLKSKYQVTTAIDGTAGLQAAQDLSFDLIISDLMMPKMDGIELCTHIKNDLTTSHIPVILLTAKALEESKLSGYVRGADDYIIKPFNPELLLTRIDNLLQQRAQLREVYNKEFMLTPKKETLESPDTQFLAKLSELMQDNLSESEFNVEAMCKAMHLSHMHFIRKVKQLTGKKPVDLLRSYRMKKARDLLAQNSLTISEVAYRVGFDLPNSFSRAFKKEYAMTPSQFIRTLESEEVS